MNGVLPVTTLFLLQKVLLQFKNLLLRVDLMYQLPKYSYQYFRSKRLSFN